MIVAATNDASITTYKTPGLLARLSRRQPHSYNHTVDVAVGRPDSQPRERERAPAPTVATAHLETGEKRTLSTFRTRDPISDVVTPLIWSLAGGTLIAVASIPPTLWWTWLPWWTPISAWPIATAALYFTTARQMLSDKSLVTHEIEMERKTPPPPPTPTRSSRILNINLANATGDRRQYADLPDTPEFWRLAAAVAGHDAPFSETTATAAGMSVDVEQFDDVDQMGFRQLRDLFVDRHWAKWKNRKSRKQGVKLYAAGREILRSYAEAPPPPGAQNVQ